MKRGVVVAAFLTCCLGASAQTPQATDLPGSPFSIKKTWIIGGEGNWDYLKMDARTGQLFIPHGRVVQVVDVKTGQVVGQVTGLRDAHDVALDEQGQFGFVTDGGGDALVVFDRSSFAVVARVPTGRNPISVVIDPTTGLVFVICPGSAPESTPQRGAPAPGKVAASPVQSTVTMIDPESHRRLADVLVSGRLGYAEADGRGVVYVNDLERSRVVYFHTQSLAAGVQNEFQRQHEEPKLDPADTPSGSENAKSNTKRHSDPEKEFVVVDWTDHGERADGVAYGLGAVRIGAGCLAPHGLAVDAADDRLFVACENMRMVVLNPQDGSTVSTVPIGAGSDAIGYDAERGLLYSSNGGGVGSLTIIHRDVADTYHVIQELPTQARARTLAINPENGEVYLVTNILGFDRNHNGGVGGLQTVPAAGSFQVLVVGN